MPKQPEERLYNLNERVLIDIDGERLPITQMFDEWGEETEEPDCCVAFIAGREGYWISMLVEGEW